MYVIYLELKEYKISLSTARRMSQVPNKHLTAAGRYRALINARVWTKENFYREFHADVLLLFTPSKICKQLGTLLSDEISLVSVDDMVKVKVGAPAECESSVHVAQMIHIQTYSAVYFTSYSLKNLTLIFSPYNPTEHVWSPLANLSAGVVFSRKLEGNNKVLWQIVVHCQN